MERFKTYNKPINPMGLHMLTQRHKVNQLGFLGLDTIISGGFKFVKDAISGAGSDRDAHIAAQNAAGEQMGIIVEAFNSLRDQGVLTYQEVQNAKAGIMQIAQTFADFANRLGTARATQGAADVMAIARQITSDMERDAQRLGLTSAGIPRIDPTTGEVTYPQPVSKLPIPDVGDWTPYLLGGAILAAALLSRGRG